MVKQRRCRYLSLLNIGLISMMPQATLAAVDPKAPAPDARVAPLLQQAEKALLAGRNSQALPVLTEALSKSREIKDKIGEINALSNLGWYYGAVGELAKQADFYNQSLALAKEIGDEYDQAGILTNIGLAYAETSQSQKGLQTLRQALELACKVGDRATEARATNSIGFVYFNLNQLEQALGFYDQGLKIHREMGNKGSQASTLNNIGMVYRQAKDPVQALEFFGQSLILRRETGDQGGEATTLQNMGLIYHSLGQSSEALDLFQQGLKLAQAGGNKKIEATILNNIGALYIAVGRTDEGLEALQQVLPLRRALQDIPGAVSTLTNLATAEKRLQRPQKARDHMRAAVELLEQERALIGNMPESKISYLESNLQPYGIYIDLLLSQKEDAEAFNWAQKVKARALLDLMASDKVDLSKRIGPTERQQKTGLQQRLSQAHMQYVELSTSPKADPQQLVALGQQLQQTQAEIQQFNDALYAKYPDLAGQQAVQTATLPDVPQFLSSDTAILEFVVLRSPTARAAGQCAVLCVTVENKQPVVKSYRVTVPYPQLIEKIDRFREECAAPDGDYRASARDLYNLLVAPAAKQLEGKKQLVICPDGELWGLPFQALIKGRVGTQDQFLIDAYGISYSYSATALQVTGQKSARLKAARQENPAPTTAQGPARLPQKELLIMANPQFSNGITPLPGTKAEAEAIKALFPEAVVYTGDNAQEATVKAQAGDFRYLHFATHGALDAESPMLSSVILAKPATGSPDNGFLTAHEIFDLSLSAEMVVLSACDTANGDKQGGEGVVGLSWALFVAGAPTQVLSQWPVADQSTALLMKQFYANLKQGKPKGEALRMAMLSMKKNPAFAQPVFWAPFILIGEWKK